MDTSDEISLGKNVQIKLPNLTWHNQQSQDICWEQIIVQICIELGRNMSYFFPLLSGTDNSAAAEFIYGKHWLRNKYAGPGNENLSQVVSLYSCLKQKFII